jgi:hypothetical protein
MANELWWVAQGRTDPTWMLARIQRQAIVAVLDIIEHGGRALADLPHDCFIGSTMGESDEVCRRIRHLRDAVERDSFMADLYHPTEDDAPSVGGRPIPNVR